MSIVFFAFSNFILVFRTALIASIRNKSTCGNAILSMHFKIRTRKPTVSTFAASGTLSNKVLQGATSYTVALINVCDIASERAIDLERKIIAVHNGVRWEGDIMFRLFPPQNILKNKNNPSPQNHGITCRYLDATDTEVRKRRVFGNNGIQRAQRSRPSAARKDQITFTRCMQHVSLSTFF